MISIFIIGTLFHIIFEKLKIHTSNIFINKLKILIYL